MKANLLKSHQFKRVFIHPDLPKRERQLAANFRKVVNAVQNSDVRLFVKGSRVMSSRRSLVDEQSPIRDRSQESDPRDSGASPYGYERYEHENMDSCISYSADSFSQNGWH